MSGPRYHPSLTDGTFDKLPRPDAATLRHGIANIEQHEPIDCGEVLAEFDRTKKGEGAERLQIAVKKFEGHSYLDLRIWWRRHDGTWLPGKKGITIRARELADLQRVIGEAERLMGAT